RTGPPPPAGPEAAPCRSTGRRPDGVRDGWHAPPGEPCGRRARIDPGHVLEMLPKIHQNVDERVPHDPRRGERPHVIPVAPHPSPAAERAVDAAGDPDGEATESAR